MKQNLLFNQASALGKRFIMVLTMLLTVGIGQAWGAGTETFENAASSTSYGSVSWEGVNGLQWSASSFRTDQKISGNRGLTSKASTECTITMPLTSVQQSEGMGVFTFKYKYPYSDSGKKNNLSFTINGSTYTGTVSYNSNAQTVNITVNQSNLPATITINIASGGRACFDDFSWTSYVSADPYTVTLKDDNSTLTQSSAGESVTLPPRNGCDGYEFVGWTKSWSVAQTTWTTTAPTIIPTGSYTPTANESLYPVYTKTETTQGTPTTTSKTYTHTITAKTWSTNGAQTLNNVSWTLTNDGNYYGYDGTKGQQVGSGSSPAKSMTLTTSGFSSATKITAVRISTSGASSISGSVGVTVGSTAFKSGTATTKSLSSTNTEYEFTGSSSGNVTISWSQTSSKAIYFKAIEVDYQTTTGGGNTTTTYYISVPDCSTETLVSLDPNGGTISDVNGDWDLVDGLYKQTTTESNIVLPTITKGNWTFAGWDKDADGVKDYEATETITLNGTDVELSALWECTPLPAPTGLDAEPTSDGGRISWNQVTNATGYEISTDGGNTWGLSINGGSNTSHILKNRECETPIEWQVRAVGNMGNGYCEENPAASHSFTTLECGCPSYSFHYGIEGQSDWEIKCFEQAGADDPKYILPELFTMPNTGTHNYYVGYQGNFYNDNLGYIGQSKSENVRLQYMRLTQPMANGGGVYLGTDAVGATGTVVIYDNSQDNNLAGSFDPSGYGIKVGDTWNAFSLPDPNSPTVWETTDILTMPATDTEYQTGIATAASYVPVSNSSSKALNTMAVSSKEQGKKVIWFVPNNNWDTDNPRYAVYFFVKVNGTTKEKWVSMTKIGDKLYKCLVPTDNAYEQMIFCRMNPGSATNSWDTKKNQSGDLDIPGGLATKYTLNSNTNWDGFTDNLWSVHTPPSQGQQGKYRMWSDNASSNFSAHWIPWYVLTYDKNATDATGSTEVTAISSEAASYSVTTNSCGFTRTGYDFVNWQTQPNGGTAYSAGATYTLSADATLYAQWQAKNITITWNPNGGNVTPPTSTYTYDGASVDLPIPTRIGYTFNGWFDAASGGTPIPDVGNTNKPAEDVTYYAQWTAKPIPTLVWKLKGADVTEHTVTIASESNVFPTLTATPEAIKSGVKFESSEPTVATINANGDIILKSEGRTTIKAYYEEDATYAAAEATYELTVVESTNCWWEEVTIDDIVYGDEVVIAMEKNGSTYALADNNTAATSAPSATEISINANKTINTDITNISTSLIWNIDYDKEGTKNLVIYSTKNAGKWLYSTNANDGVRIGDNTNKEFKILEGTEADAGNFFLYHIEQTRYLGVYYQGPDWRGYTTINYLITGQTLKFYKKVCLPEGQYRVTWDANGGAWSDGTTTKEEIYTEGAIINQPEEPELDGYKFDSWEPAPSIMPEENTTFKAKWAKLHTITWMVGGSELTTGSQTTSVENGKKITEIPANPNDNTLNSCGANKFMGWSTQSSGSTPEDADYYNDLFTTVAESPEITKPTTFYAVFATAEETTGGTVDATLSFANTQNRVSHSNSQHVWAQNDITFTNNKASSTSDVNEAYNPIRCYKNSSITITHTSNEITKIVFDCNGTTNTSHISDLISPLENSGTGTVTRSDDIITITFNESKESFTLNLSSGQVRLDGITVTAGGGTITTYSNYVTNCCALAPATNLTVSGTTANSATLTWTAPSPTTDITKLQVRDGSGNVVVDNLAANTTSATISGLIECTSYQYYVVSVGEDCEVVSDIVTAQPYGGAKTVNYDYNGGSGSPESFTTSCDDDKREIILPVATRPGYTFEGWYDPEGNKVGDAGATYDPATSPITLYAHWTENTYQLIHSGSNYTITENKTSIKSSDTPFTLHYTCTGDYGLPATISITGGGKSWTVNTDYTWEVAADKQSATLVIKETVISADVTITINVATRYTVTFVHNDKGVFSGSEAIEVLSSENTITLPTVTDVSCGFYDTFEGWIVADEDYTESTSKPAGTIYKGGANYTVNSDCTLRALYSKCEGDATQVYRKVTATGEVTDGTYILVATFSSNTSYVYSGNGTNTYGSYVADLIPDDNDFSSELPQDADPITISIGSGSNAGKFAMYNANEEKYLTYTGSSNTLNTADSEAFVWYLTDGSQKINGTECPQGALTPSDDARVLQLNASSTRFACYKNTAAYPHVFLYKLIDKCTKYYSTNPSCEKPVGVHIVYNANAVDASMSCSTQDRTYKVENEVNKYPQLASQLQFCTNATREGYTLVGWNTQSNGQGTTYNINQNYYNLPVSGELDGDKWITLNLYAMWKPCIKFNLGNATGGTGVPDAVVENGGCVLPTPTAEQLGTIPCGYEFYAWSETSVNATQTKPALFMPGDTYTGSALTLYAVYRWCEGNTGSDTYYFTFNVNSKTYCITQKHNSYARFVVEEATSGLIFGLENGYLYYLDEGVKTFVYWAGDGTTVMTTTTYPNDAKQKTTFVEGDNGTTIVTPAISGRYLQMPSSYTDRAYYTTDEINPTLVEVQTTTCTYATNPTCYTNTNLHFVTNGGTLNYPTDYDETNYQELAIGDDILLPTATFAGEWTFEGWKRGSQLESQTIKPYDPSFYPVTPNSTLFEVDELGDIYFYAVYSKTNNDKQFDPENGGTYKLFAIGEDGTKTYMPMWSGGRGTLIGVTTCAETGDYTITPGTGTHAGHYQITCGEHTLGVQSDTDTDLKEAEGTWWNIEHSESGKGTWRITVVGSSNRALSCLFSTAKFFGNYTINELNRPNQPTYRDMEIGECIYTEYTSTPENIPYITITGAPVKITSTNGERVYAPTTLHIEAHNFTGERIIHLSATNGFGVDPVQVRTNGQGAYSGDVKVYYEPTADGDGQTITTSVFTASQTGGTNDEKISQTFTAIQGRNMPANFVIAAKWDGLWYALPANCTTSNSSTEGLLIEVDDVDNPTKATSAPASAKYGIREVIPSRQTNNGKAIVFTERFAEGDKQFALYNGSNANIQVNAQYTNYAQTNPDPYEWIPSTSDFKDYTLTNASTGRNLGLTSGTFGAYTAASNMVRLLPATFYEPATAQVLKWKANSVIVMYTGAETTATTQVGVNAQSAEQTLADQKLTHGIYELTTAQALTINAGGTLSLYFGANTRVELEIPLIISGEVTASANAHDVVILENSKLTADATKYSYKDVYVYGGAKLAIPDGTELGVNNIILRAGAVATNGAGQNATYQYIYPQVELKGTLTSAVQNIRYEYVTDNDHWYHLVLPFDGSLASIHYPYEYYGDQVALNNTGSWIIKRYDGATRATGNYDAWKDIEKDEPTATTVTAGKGYIYWGAPKKITANGEYDRPTWGIQRITMSVSAPDAKIAENGNKTISGLGSYENVPNNSGKDNDQGWNLIGNPYMVDLTGLNSNSLKTGQLIKVRDDNGNWTGGWELDSIDAKLRYITLPSHHFEWYEAKRVSKDLTLDAGRAFFVQINSGSDGVEFEASNRVQLMPALRTANNNSVDIETGIVLSNETLQDEVNFWIKDGKTNDYEYNADYPKTPNNNQFNIYGVHTNGDLSWVAISPEIAAESMPIGYQVPAAGTYMLSVSEEYYSDEVDALLVTDHEMSPEVTADLMITSYEFSVNQAETNNKRFTVAIKLKNGDNNDATGLDNLGIGNEHLMKFIYQDKIYILHHGVIYDATGKRVITINK